MDGGRQTAVILSADDYSCSSSSEPGSWMLLEPDSLNDTGDESGNDSDAVQLHPDLC